MFDLTKIEETSIPMSEFSIDRTPGIENVRDLSAYSDARLYALMEDLILQGQTDAIVCYRRQDGDGKWWYKIVRGFRRLTALQKLAEQKRKFEGGEYTGNVPEFVRAKVLPDGLTPAQITALMFDHSQRESLNVLELQRGVEMCLAAQEDERVIVVLFQSLFNTYYPPKRDITDPSVDGGKDLQAYHHGTYQCMKAAFAGPDCLRLEWHRKLATGKGLQKSDMVTMSKIYCEEAEKDLSGTINKSSPGPKFMEKWNKYLAAQAEGPKGNKAKPLISMRNREQTEAARDICKSRFAKLLFMLQLGDLPADLLPALDAAQVELEKTGNVSTFQNALTQLVAPHTDEGKAKAAADKAAADKAAADKAAADKAAADKAAADKAAADKAAADKAAADKAAADKAAADKAAADKSTKRK